MQTAFSRHYAAGFNQFPAELSPQERGYMIELFNEKDEDEEASELFSQIADKLSITRDSLRRYCALLMQYDAMANEMIFGHEPIFTSDHKKRIKLPVYTPPARLTDIQWIDEDTDQLEWVNWLQERFQDAPDLSIMHACDVHAPFQDDDALELFYQMAKETQPDLVVAKSLSSAEHGLAA